MKQQWLNFVLHFTALISRQKQKLLAASALATIPIAFRVIVLEAALFLISLPAYIFISPTVFAGGNPDAVATYRLRRIVSLSVVLGTMGVWLLYIILGTVGVGLFPKKTHAFTQTWSFNQPLGYVYDPGKIQIVDGMAVFKAEHPTTESTTVVETTVAASSTTNVEATPTVEPAPAPQPEADLPVTETTETVVEPAPVAPEPTPTPAIEPAPAPSSPLLFNTVIPSGGSSRSRGISLQWVKGFLHSLRNSVGMTIVETANAQSLTCEATLQPLTPFLVTPLKQWTGFIEVATKNGGEIYYQLSDDAGVTWKYWNGSAWTLSGLTHFNTAADINSNIESFPTLTGSILFKAKLVSDCAHDMQMLNVSVDYDRLQTGNTLTAGDTAVSFTDTAGIPLSTATSSVYVNYLGTPTAKLTLSGNLDLTNQVVGAALGSSWLSLAEPALSSVSAVQLILPKTNSSASVRVCPGALAVVSIVPNCVGETILNSGQSSANGFALANVNDSSHWYIEVSTTGTLALGAMEVAPETTPVTEQLTACGNILNGANVATLLATPLTSNDYIFSGEVKFSSSGQADIIVRHENDTNLWKLHFGNGTVQFVGLVNGVSTLAENANIADFVPQAGATYKFKVQVNGLQLRAKWWLATDTEPSAWLLYAADNRILSGGVSVATPDATAVLGNVFGALSISSCLGDETVVAPEPVTPSTPEPAPVVSEPTLTAPDLSIVLIVESSAPTVSTPAVETTVTTTIEAPNVIPAPEIIPAVPVEPTMVTVTENSSNNLVVTLTGTGGSSATLETPTPLDPAVQHEVTITADAGGAHLYVDGIVVDTAPTIIVNPEAGTVVVTSPTIVTVVEAVQTVLTPVEVATDYLLSNNHAPEVLIASAAQQTDDGYVDINYRVSDAESNYVSLAKYEYSLTGNFTGEEKTMTLATANLDNEGRAVLTSSASGIAHVLVWNAKADLGNIYDSRVYVRLKPTDGLEAGSAVVSAPFAVDLKAPVITQLKAEQVYTLGTQNIKVTYRVIDETQQAYINFSVSTNDRTPAVIKNASGDTGVMDANGSDTKTILWNIDGENLDNKDTIVFVTLNTSDALNNTFSVTLPVTIDTKPPFGLANFHGSAANTTQIEWAWSPVANESNFDHYELWYGTERAAVLDHRTSSCTGVANCVSTWTTKEDNDLGIMGTHATIVTKLTPSTTYFATIVAVDTFGNKTEGEVVEYTTLPINAVVVPLVAVKNIAPNVSGGSSATLESSLGAGGWSHGNVVEPVLPKSALETPTKPTGGFDITINNGDVKTDSANVTLSLKAGDDTATMAISNYADLHDAIQEPYSVSKQWDLCAEQGGLVQITDCSSGKQTVYVKFYTKFGQSSEIVSDSINLFLPSPSTASSSASVAGEASVSSPSQRRGQGEVLPRSPTVSLASVAPASAAVLQALSQTKESPILARPEVGTIQQSSVANKIELSGKGIPRAKIALFIHSDQVVVYTTEADDNGNWRYTHDQNKTKLSPGEHTLYAVTYDSDSGIKSRPTPVKTFFVKENRLAIILSYFDVWTTLLTLGVAVVVIVFLAVRKLQNKNT